MAQHVLLYDEKGQPLLTAANPGFVLAQLTGSILADNGTGTPVALTAVQRPDGSWVLLTAEATSPDGAIAYPVASNTADEQAIAAATGLRLVGWSVTEGAATPSDARIRLHHGTANSGPELFDVTLSPGESAREWFDLGGIAVPNGVFVDRVSGTTRLTLYVRVVA